ncbi:MAG: alpha/beta hydrolase [Flavobacteriales bacterium]
MMLQEKFGIKYLERKPKVEKELAPLLVLIHGYGSNEADLFGFAEDLPPKYHIVSLQGIRSVSFGGFCWYDIDFVNMEKHSNFEQALEARDQIKNFIEQFTKEQNLSKKGITLCGFSQGCILSYSLALHNPDLIQNVVALSGYPESHILPKESKKDVSHLNFFISHGSEDAVIPVEWARNIKSIMHHLKINYIYREYPAGHGINPENYKDMMQWIYQL